MTVGRITQAGIVVVSQSDPAAQVTQAGVTMVSQSDPNGVAEQVAVRTVSQSDPNGIAEQVAVRTVSQSDPNGIAEQVAVRVVSSVADMPTKLRAEQVATRVVSVPDPTLRVEQAAVRVVNQMDPTLRVEQTAVRVVSTVAENSGTTLTGNSSRTNHTSTSGAISQTHVLAGNSAKTQPTSTSGAISQTNVLAGNSAKTQPTSTKAAVRRPYRYWRLNVTANDGDVNFLAIAELEMRSVLGGADQCSGGTASASSADPATPASNAVDNNSTTRWSTVSGTITGWWQYEFANPVCVVGYTIQAHPTAAARSPKDWTLECSDDGIAWTVADRRSGVDGWENGLTRGFATSVGVATGAYSRWLLSIDDSNGVVSNGLAIAEIEMRATPGGADQLSGGTASASSATSSSEGNAVDNNAATSWVTAANIITGWWQYQFATPVSVAEYTIQAHPSVAVSAPKNWKLLASNDGIDWYLADNRNSQTGWTNGQIRTYQPTLSHTLTGNSAKTQPTSSKGEADPYFSSVVLLCHFDGVDGATTTVDSSASAKTVTLFGTAQLDTAVKKFGSASLLLPDGGDFAQVADSSDWNFGVGDFTVEAQVLFDTAVNGNHAIIGQWGTTVADDAWFLLLTGGSLIFSVYNSSGVLVDVGAPWTPTLDTWYHVAAERSGNTLRVYVNGTVHASDAAYTHTLQNSTVPLHTGRVNSTFPSYDLDGSIDEVRITKGVARYKGAFTPPESAHPDGPAATTLTGNNAKTQPTATSGAISQTHLLTGNNCRTNHTATSGALSSTHNLTGNSAKTQPTSTSGAISQTHLLAGNSAKTQPTSSSGAISSSLLGNNAKTQPTSSSGAISQTHLLTGNSAKTQPTATTGAISQTHLLTGNSAKTQPTSSSGAITQTQTLTGNSVKQPNTSSSGNVVSIHLLAGNSVKQPNTSTNGAAQPSGSLQGNSVKQPNTSSSGAITQTHALTGNSAKQPNTSSSARVYQLQTITGADSKVRHTDTAGAIFFEREAPNAQRQVAVSLEGRQDDVLLGSPRRSVVHDDGRQEGVGAEPRSIAVHYENRRA